MPIVSIIVPCYNEQATIGLLLQALYTQTFPRSEMEVIIADGMSSDRTREEIAVFQSKHPDLAVRVIDNRQRTIPSGLNRAIEAAYGQFVVRLDAHSVPRPNYVACCIEALEKGRGENVGGVWEILPGGPGPLARAIAVAAAHPLGVGDAFYRHAEQAQAVDTVPFGAFRRELVDQIGPFDERLLTNEDYEFNTRVRKAGGTVWLDPEIRSRYYARANLAALAQQYWRYGYWKVQMLRRYPESIRWRQALPPVFVASLLTLAFFGLWLPLARWVLLLELLVYASALVAAGLQRAVKGKDWTLAWGVPLAIVTMHVTWGGAFLWSLIAGGNRTARKT